MQAEPPLKAQLLAAYDDMPRQLRTAAHWVLHHPFDVALLSMRDQAERAGVPPTTMTRLAKRLGLAGYDDIREMYADAFRERPVNFAQRATDLVERRREGGEHEITFGFFLSLENQINVMRSEDSLTQISRAATAITTARRSYVIGQRSSYPVAFQLSYLCALAGPDIRLLDGPGGIGLDHLRDASTDDIVIAISVRPYTKATIKIAEYAVERGVQLLAITDTSLSPLARLASTTVFVETETLSMLPTLTSAFAAVEAIATLVAGQGESRTRAALERSDNQFDALDTFAMPRRVSRTRATTRKRKPLL